MEGSDGGGLACVVGRVPYTARYGGRGTRVLRLSHTQMAMSPTTSPSALLVWCSDRGSQ